MGFLQRACENFILPLLLLYVSFMYNQIVTIVQIFTLFYPDSMVNERIGHAGTAGHGQVTELSLGAWTFDLQYFGLGLHLLKSAFELSFVVYYLVKCQTMVRQIALIGERSGQTGVEAQL